MFIKSTPIHVIDGKEYFLKEYWDAQDTVIVDGDSNKTLDPRSMEYFLVLEDYLKTKSNSEQKAYMPRSGTKDAVWR